MNSTDQIGETPSAAQDRVQRQLDRLERLGGLGMGLAEEIAKRASAPAEQGQVSADELCGLSLAYTRVSRAVRQIIALEQEAMGLRAMRDRSWPVNMLKEARESDRRAASPDDNDNDNDDGDLDRNIDDLRDVMDDLDDLLDRSDLDDGDESDTAEHLAARIQATLERIQAKIPLEPPRSEDAELGETQSSDLGDGASSANDDFPALRPKGKSRQGRGPPG